MELLIPAFAAGQPVPTRFTCDGADLSPPLQWSDTPPETRSLALIVDDPDAPSGLFSHWGAFDIDPTAGGLEEGAGNAQDAPFRQARNDFGHSRYGGPCPPRGHGAHRYRFTLLALDVMTVRLGSVPTIGELRSAVEGHVLASATVEATYVRN